MARAKKRGQVKDARKIDSGDGASTREFKGVDGTIVASKIRLNIRATARGVNQSPLHTWNGGVTCVQRVATMKR
jgi:hypothetical protein